MQLVARRGAPQYLRSDNGPEFIARRIQRWLAREGITTAYIDPGKPWQNGVGESFHSRFRDECLDQEAFFTVHEAAVIIEQYRRTYNQARPHSSLHYHTPAEVAQRRARPHRERSSQHGRQPRVSVGRAVMIAPGEVEHGVERPRRGCGSASSSVVGPGCRCGGTAR